MTWKDKLLWKKLKVNEIIPGMKAKLVIENSWTYGAWVEGRKGQVFTVAEHSSGSTSYSVSVYVKDIDIICSDNIDNFVFKR